MIPTSRNDSRGSLIGEAAAAAELEKSIYHTGQGWHVYSLGLAGSPNFDDRDLFTHGNCAKWLTNGRYGGDNNQIGRLRD